MQPLPPKRAVHQTFISFGDHPSARLSAHRPTVGGVWLLFALMSVFMLAAILGAGIAAAAGQGDFMKRMRCLACHVGESQHRLDGQEHISKSSTIDMPQFESADHGKMLCADCHSKGFTNFPHRNMKTETCMGCHPRKEAKEAEADKKYEFHRINKEFEATVHFTEYQHNKERCCGTAPGKQRTAGAGANRKMRETGNNQRFTCEHCHEPHYFTATARIKDPKRILKNDNGPCLHCHMDGSSVALKDPAGPNLVAAHAYLPYADQHLNGTRCVDCHTSVSPTVAHDLPLGRKADQGCNTCHSIDSIEVRRLYRYVDNAHATKAGFHNAALMKNGYVMGANRNRWADLAAYLLVSMGLVLVLAHGGWRMLARKQK